MQHLDEGALQAWLDGPRAGLSAEERAAIERHLEACPACARRMEALRDDDLRAASLLAPRETDHEIPAFEAVVARARTLGSGDHRRRRWMRVGWAASVCAALGVGWLTNDLMRGEGERLAGTAAATADATVGQAEGGQMADAAGAAAARALDDGAAAMAERNGAPAALRADEPTTAMARRPGEPGTPQAADAALSRPRTTDQAAPATERTAAAEDLPAPAVAAPVLATRADSAGDTAFPAVAAPSPAAPALERIAPAGPLPFVAAPDDRLADAPREREAAEVAGEAVVVRGRVTDEAGRPLQSAQVYEAGGRAGTLTGADGTFTLRLDAAANPASPRPTLSVALIGYEPESRVLPVAGGLDTMSAEFRLSATALSLDELVVTGMSVDTAPEASGDRAVPPPGATEEASSGAGIVVPSPAAAPGRWTSMSQTDAEAAVGFGLRTVPGLEIVAVAVGTFQGEAVVRVVQALAGADNLTLLESRSAVAFDDGWLEEVANEGASGERASASGRAAASGRAPTDGRAPTSGRAGTASVMVGDVRIVAAAPLPADSVRVLLERVR